jgi:hypothetical protein
MRLSTFASLLLVSGLASAGCSHGTALARVADPCAQTAGARLVIRKLEPDLGQPLVRGQRVDLQAEISYFVPELKTVFLRMMVIDPNGQDIWQPHDDSPPVSGEGTASVVGHFWVSSKIEGRITLAAAAFKPGDDAHPVAGACRLLTVR